MVERPNVEEVIQVLPARAGHDPGRYPGLERPHEDVMSGLPEDGVQVDVVNGHLWHSPHPGSAHVCHQKVHSDMLRDQVPDHVVHLLHALLVCQDDPVLWGSSWQLQDALEEKPHVLLERIIKVSFVVVVLLYYFYAHTDMNLPVASLPESVRLAESGVGVEMCLTTSTALC